jgi:hypothetical protein
MCIKILLYPLMKQLTNLPKLKKEIWNLLFDYLPVGFKYSVTNYPLGRVGAHLRTSPFKRPCD